MECIQGGIALWSCRRVPTRFGLVTGSQFFPGDRGDLPVLDFFKVPEEPSLQLGLWREVSLPGGGYHLSRHFDLSNDFNGYLRMHLLNYHPVDFYRIDLINDEGDSVLDSPYLN